MKTAKEVLGMVQAGEDVVKKYLDSIEKHIVKEAESGHTSVALDLVNEHNLTEVQAKNLYQSVIRELLKLGYSAYDYKPFRQSNFRIGLIGGIIIDWSKPKD